MLVYDPERLVALATICGRGGLLRPIEGGTYLVNKAMIQDLNAGYSGRHTSYLGGIIANEIASSLNLPAFIVNPVIVDELAPNARISGFSAINRKSIFHALNQKAVADATQNKSVKNTTPSG